MEKNTLLAIVLSVAVLLLWSYLFGSPKRQESPENKTESAQPAGPATVAVQPSNPVPVPEQNHVEEVSKPTRPSRLVTVRHPLYAATLSEQGGEIVSFKLTQYKETNEPDSPLQDLFWSEHHSLELMLDRKSVPGLSTGAYTSDKTEVEITDQGSPQQVTFTYTSPEGFDVVKRYTFRPASYVIDLDVAIRNRSESFELDDNVILRLKGAPFEVVKGYYNITKVVVLVGGNVESEDTEDVEKAQAVPGEVRWASYHDNYFVTAMVTDEPFKGSVRFNPVDEKRVDIDMVHPALRLPRGMEIHYPYHLYFGPRQLDLLKESGLGLARLVDYGWFDIIAKPVLYLLRWLYKGVGNYGIAIIIVTILIKILFWPLTHKSYSSMKAMQRLQPQMMKIREQYKDDKQKLNAEVMTLYKNNKVNPMGGCLPMLIQIPVFFALYRILGQSIEIRHAPFMLWINDLSAPDRLAVGFHIPYTGGLPVLTLLMGLSMFIQQKMTPTPGDPTQAKMMMMLPIVFTFLFINFPSGLVLYWLVNNVLSIGQQYFINKKA